MNFELSVEMLIRQCILEQHNAWTSFVAPTDVREAGRPDVREAGESVDCLSGSILGCVRIRIRT